MRGRSGSRRQDISGAEHTGRRASVVCTHQLTLCSLDCRPWAFAPAGHVAPWRISFLSQPSARVYRWLAPCVSAATAPSAASDDARACKHACYYAATANRSEGGTEGATSVCPTRVDPISSRSQRTDDIASLQTAARYAEPGKAFFCVHVSLLPVSPPLAAMRSFPTTLRTDADHPSVHRPPSVQYTFTSIRSCL
jgi:hypothetical protein